jgi:rhodanese-related sulfurtransferase
MKHNTGSTKIFIIVALVLLAGVAYYFSSPEEPASEQSLDVAVISAEIKNNEAVLLDVRTEKEIETDGYAAGSMHFNLALLEAGELPNIPRNIRVYIYCLGGVRAEKAKTILEENGFTDVINIGGCHDWEVAGGEVIR